MTMTFSELANLLNKRSKENAHATRYKTRTTRQGKQRKKESRPNV